MTKKVVNRTIFFIGVFLLFISVISTFYNSIVLGSFYSYGVVFHDNPNYTEVAFYYDKEFYKFDTTESSLEGHYKDLESKLGNKFSEKFLLEYEDFFMSHYSETI